MAFNGARTTDSRLPRVRLLLALGLALPAFAMILLTVFGPDAVAQAGSSGRNAADHVRPARNLAALAAQFIGI